MQRGPVLWKKIFIDRNGNNKIKSIISLKIQDFYKYYESE